MSPAHGGPAGDGVRAPVTVPTPTDDQRSLRYMLSVYGTFKGGARRILGSSFLFAIGSGMSWFALILYINELFPRLTNTAIVFSVASWTAVFFFLPGGWFVDRYDRRQTLAFAMLLSTLAMAMFSIAQSLLMIVVAQMLNGAANATSRPAFQALMTEKTSDRRRKYLFSMQSFVSMMGVAVASGIAGVGASVAESLGVELVVAYRVLFMLSAFAQVVAIAISLSIRPGEEGRESESERLTSPVEVAEDKEEARRRSLVFIVKFSTPMALIGFGAGFVVPFFQLYYRLKFDVLVSEVAWLFLVTNLAMGLAFFLVPNLAERRGSVGAVVATQGVAVLALVAIPFSPVFLVAAPFHLIRMALMNASTPIQQSLMMGAVRPTDRGKATGIAQLTWTVTNSVGITFSGYVMDTYGLDFPFVIAVAFYSVAVAMFWMFFRRVGEM